MYLIACSQSKLNPAAQARDLYTGQAFKMARQLAEHSGRPYLILSALYGLVDPLQALAPYNLHLASTSKAFRAQWVQDVNAALSQRGITSAVALAGATYLDGLSIDLDRPLKGLGIGQQLRYLSQALNNI
jgi:cytoplasmic iron level regulating protein YaaA (DUF328/UPF0246 family)